MGLPPGPIKAMGAVEVEAREGRDGREAAVERAGGWARELEVGGTEGTGEKEDPELELDDPDDDEAERALFVGRVAATVVILGAGGLVESCSGAASESESDESESDELSSEESSEESELESEEEEGGRGRLAAVVPF